MKCNLELIAVDAIKGLTKRPYLHGISGKFCPSSDICEGSRRRSEIIPFNGIDDVGYMQ
jgi:hypothetical protein